MRGILTLSVIGLLAACGADGDPVRPSVNTTIGVGTGGVHTSTSVSTGNVTLAIGL